MQWKRNLVFSCIMTLSAGTIVMASDWVEEEGISDFQTPRRTRNVPIEQNSDVEEHRGQPRPHRFSSEEVSEQEAQVEDDGGGHGIPEPKKKKGNLLEGGVSHFHSGLPQNQNNDAPPRFGLIQQEPTAIHYPPAKETIVEAKTFRAWIEKNHPELQGNLQAQREQIIEVKGKWDDSGHVLKAFGLGCSKVPPEQLNKYDLSKSKILIVDCAGNVPQDGLDAINKFVRGGGYLLTTDWALEGCLQKAVPGFIEWNGDNTSETRVVDAYLKTDDPILTQGTVPRAHWKLDRKCQLMRIIKPARVEVLAASVQLKTDDSQGLGNLAATFRFGKGKVLHLVGHFDYNSGRAFNNLLPDPAPKIGISLRQAIAANFIAEALGQGGAAPETPQEN